MATREEEMYGTETAATGGLDPNLQVNQTATGGGVLTPPKVTEDYQGVTQQQQQQASAASTTTQPGYNATQTAQDIAQVGQVQSGDSAVSDKSLVATQLEQILGKDSPLMRQAGSRGQVQASRLGRLGSTAGIAAAQAPLIAQGFEIASRDAQTYGQANLQAQQARNQQALTQVEGVVSGSLAQQKAALQERQQALDNAFQSAIQGADASTRVALQDFQQQWQGMQSELERDFEKWSTEFQIDAQQKESLAARRGEALMNYQLTTQELLGDPEFLRLGGDAIANLMNTMADGVISTVRYDMRAAGYAANDPVMTAFLNDLADDLYLDFSGIPEPDEE